MIHNSKKKLGQHFLTSKKIADRIADAASIVHGDTIVEVGPGKGMLTDAIAKKNPKKIIAIEKDKQLIMLLQKKYKNEARIKIIEEDIRKIFPKLRYTLRATPYKVVANIPYYLTSYLIRLLLENGPTKPKSIVFMVQKEVADRIVARPPKMNLLALSVQSMGDARIAFSVPKKYFSPPPKIDSAVIIIENISDIFFKTVRKEKFFELLHYGFGQKRKMLIANLAKKTKNPRSGIEHVFSSCGVDHKARAENLSLEQWECLTEKIINIKI